MTSIVTQSFPVLSAYWSMLFLEVYNRYEPIDSVSCFLSPLVFECWGMIKQILSSNTAEVEPAVGGFIEGEPATRVAKLAQKYI